MQSHFHLPVILSCKNYSRIKYCTYQINLGPAESHTVHKLRTTKIVVEEASSPDMGGTFTFIASQSSKKSEISVEEVGSYRLENESMPSESNVTIENVDSSSDIHQRSRQLSIVSVASEDDKNKSCEDDGMDDLLTRIKKQRSDLENILGIERKLSEESKNISTNQLRDDDNKKDEMIEGTFHLQ